MATQKLTQPIMTPLFERRDLPERGRCLVASSSLEKGQLIFCERPLLALQSLDNQQYVKVCHGCKAFVGNADWALQRDQIPESPLITSCRQNCGQVFCSPACERDSWAGFHQHLCTGKCTSMEDPLVQFKQYAAETNEILLLVAEWWVAQHSCSQTQQYAYTDFCMEPWWNVVASDLSHSTDGAREAAVLQQSLKDICETAARLLTKVFQETTDIPPISALDIAQRIGACEQNAMGIRQRNPLCRAVLEDPKLRSQHHQEICQALADTGFIGDDGDDSHSNGDEKEPAAGPQQDIDNDVNESEPNNGIPPQGWEYSEDEIATFFSNLFIDEDGTVRDESTNNATNSTGHQEEDAGGDDNEDQQRNSTGDDLDYVFPPLDGTAMYAIACKMNHSCDPNVVMLYAPSHKWNEPLAVHAVALKNIEAGAELTISYIEIDGSLETRQQALSNYGFQCTCGRCLREKGMGEKKEKSLGTPSDKVNDLFGDEDEDEKESDKMVSNDDDPFGSDEESEDGNAPLDPIPSTSESKSDNGNTLLEKRLDRLDTASNHAMPQISKILLAKVSAFVVQHATQITEALPDGTLAKDLVPQCSLAMVQRDFCMCRILGRELEESLFTLLTKQGSFLSVAERHAYWISGLVASVGFAHVCRFVTAMQYLDKVMILGLLRKDYRQLSDFVSYVEHYAVQKSHGPYSQKSLSTSTVANIPTSEKLQISYQESFAKNQLRTCPEVDSSSSSLSWDEFQQNHVQKGQPLVLRNYATGWSACSHWNTVTNICLDQGHRLVPLELGSMMARKSDRNEDVKMKEQLLSLRQLVEDYLLPSNEHGAWTLDDATASRPPLDIAYLAQHPLLSQIPSLVSSAKLEMKPILCGPDGPTHVYTWLGTGGTRTPLHFDSYDNLFVQVAGAKYIRLYSPQDTPKLYVKKDGSYGLQGNMSELDCEKEDWEAHPLARDLDYYEVVLMPGDALFLPCRWWHYVRSLSTSVSINYWF